MKRVKKETTLPKIPTKKRGRLKETELSADGTALHITGASQTGFPCDSQCGRDVADELNDSRLKAKKIRFVAVVDNTGKPLMPTTPARARKWVKSRKATWFWHFGIYCVRLNVEPSSRILQNVCDGGDTGSKKEAMTLKSELHTYLNIQSDAVTWVKDNVEMRRTLRQWRRGRTTPYRKNNLYKNINKKRIPPSIKSRWQVKLRIVDKLLKIFPISHFTFEDVAVRTKKGQRRWNVNFSPIEIGKHWFYEELRRRGTLDTKAGRETAALRKSAGLYKSKNKMSEKFDAHCVDSWVLANSTVGGHITPDNVGILYVKPLRFHRRQLHAVNPITGGLRRKYGSTMSMGLKRGSLVIHRKYGLVYVGGTSIIKDRYKNKIYCHEGISLHSIKDGKRLTQTANPSDVKFLTYNSFLTNN